MSIVSHAEHMANRNPPFSVYSLIFSATAFFSSDTFLNPSFFASASDSACSWRYQSA